MEELVLTPSTIVLLAVIIALAALAVHRMVKRGMCDCGDHCGSECDKKAGKRAGCAGCSCGAGESAACKACETADKLVASTSFRASEASRET